MTPYAVLTLRPIGVTDEIIRHRFHELARTCHPDTGHGRTEDWDRYVVAYGAIKTVAKRCAWLCRQTALSGLCKTCQGTGVTGGAFRKPIQACRACRGEGRLVRSDG